MGKTIALVACSGKKIDTKGKSVRADKLYDGAFFKASMDYIRRHPVDETFILSAYYGLLRPDDYIETYDKYLGNMKSEEIKKWSDDIIYELRRNGCDLDNDIFVFFAGKDYYEDIVRSGLINNYDIPLEGLRYGEKLHALK